MSKDSPCIYTIVVATNYAGHHWQLRISRSWVKAAGYFAFLMMLLFSAAAIDFVGLLPKAREHDSLLAENHQLKERARNLRSDVETKLAQIESYRVLAGKLRRITGAMKVTDPAIGGPVLRGPASASMIMTSGDSFLQLVEQAHIESQKSEQEMLTLWDTLSERQNFLMATPTIKPTHGYYSSPFGYRVDPINHRSLLHAGVDIAAPYGTQVLAPADGIVTFAGYENGYGNFLAIDHGYGVMTRYGHNSKLFVRVGQKVHRFDVISAVGSTGHSTGSHLHYEVIVHGLPVDPMTYILQEN